MKKNLILVFLLVLSLFTFTACNVIVDSSSSSDSSIDDSSSSVVDGGDELEYSITQVSAPDYYLSYRASVTSEKPIFTTVSDAYKVGDDNAMSVRPTVSGVDKSTGSVITDMTDVSFDITVYKWDGENYVLMDNPGTDVDVDVSAVTVDFTEDAIGGKYKVAVCPVRDMLTENQQAKIDYYTVTMEFEVVDGYNVDSVIAFSLIDNSYDKNTTGTTAGKEWVELRKQAGITVDASTVNAVVLHDDINITADDIPSKFFFKDGDSDLNASDSDYEKAKDSLRDYSYIFYRQNTLNQTTFSIYGNYFSIRTSEMPLVMRDDNSIIPDGQVVNSHSALVYITSSGEIHECNTVKGILENVNLLGNLKLQDTAHTGGLIFAKIDRQTFESNNMVARQWYITQFAQLNDEEGCATVIKDCQFYDNYNCFLYLWGGCVDIQNSTMKTCGGPVIIADNAYHSSDDNVANHPNGFVPNFVVDETSVLESWVAGTETWFVQMNATSTATVLMGLDQLFNYQGGATFLKTENGTKKLNLIAVMKSSSSESMNFKKIKASAKIGSLEFSMDNQIVQAFAGQSVLFQGSSTSSLLAMSSNTDGSYYLADAMTMAQYAAQGQLAPAADNTHAAFSGDYLGMYVGAALTGGSPEGYMGLILGGYSKLK